MSAKNSTLVRVAVVQAAPVLFNREETVAKVGRLIAEAAEEGASIVLFPESFIPAYPRGLSFGAVVGRRTPHGRLTWERYYNHSVVVPSETTAALGEFARHHEVYLVIGVTERAGGTLYCSILYFDPSGELIYRHRKLKPTGTERLIWGEGRGDDLDVIETPFGKMGGLICWENYMPLARLALYKQGVELYVAPTADARDSWVASMRHIAFEGRCFVLGCNQFVTRSMVPADLPGREELDDQPEIMCRGGSVIVSPLGEIIAGPLFDEEGILTADLDLAEVVRSKLDFDVVGHYSRPDVFGE